MSLKNPYVCIFAFLCGLAIGLPLQYGSPKVWPSTELGSWMTFVALLTIVVLVVTKIDRNRTLWGAVCLLGLSGWAIQNPSKWFFAFAVACILIGVAVKYVWGKFNQPTYGPHIL